MATLIAASVSLEIDIEHTLESCLAKLETADEIDAFRVMLERIDRAALALRSTSSAAPSASKARTKRIVIGIPAI